MLLRSWALLIGMEIIWKPEIRMAHINSSHGEKLVFQEIAREGANDDFLGALERGPGKYIPVLAYRPERSFAAQDCRIIARNLAPAKPTPTETAQCMEDALLSPSSLPRLAVQLPHRFPPGCDRALCARSCSIRGQEVPGWPRFPAAFHPTVRWVRRDSSDLVITRSSHPPLSLGIPSTILITASAA
jgi:hypothetical protein